MCYIPTNKLFKHFPKVEERTYRWKWMEFPEVACRDTFLPPCSPFFFFLTKNWSLLQTLLGFKSVLSESCSETITLLITKGSVIWCNHVLLFPNAVRTNDSRYLVCPKTVYFCTKYFISCKCVKQKSPKIECGTVNASCT